MTSRVATDLLPPKKPAFDLPARTSQPVAGPSFSNRIQDSLAFSLPPLVPNKSQLSSALRQTRPYGPAAPTASRRGEQEEVDEWDVAKDTWRDEIDLTVLENLQLGVKDFGRDQKGELEWKWTEPNSGINLKYVASSATCDLLDSERSLFCHPVG